MKYKTEQEAVERIMRIEQVSSGLQEALYLHIYCYAVLLIVPLLWSRMKPVIDALNDEEYCTQIIQVSLSIDGLFK